MYVHNPQMVGNIPQRKGRAEKGHSEFGHTSYMENLEKTQ